MLDFGGYKNQKFLLEKALQNNKFAHAYLFVGADPEKKDFALDFAKQILKISDQQFNPDLILVEKDKLKIEDIRSLISNLILKPYQSEYKVAIIDNFETITAEGANSILKTLEEPNPSTIIILLASNRKAIMLTILSRVQTLFFDQNEFNSNSLSVEEKEEIKNLSVIKKERKSSRLLAIKNYKDMETPELGKIFSLWLESERIAMQSAGGKGYQNLQALMDALNGLSRNFNKKAVLERLFLNLV